jgi:hypothetical protein
MLLALVFILGVAANLPWPHLAHVFAISARIVAGVFLLCSFFLWLKAWSLMKEINELPGLTPILFWFAMIGWFPYGSVIVWYFMRRSPNHQFKPTVPPPLRSGGPSA